MISDKDHREGLTRTCWYKIRDRVKRVNPELTEIIDEISPNMDYPIYLSYYDYGEQLDNNTSFLLGKLGGGTYGLDHPDMPQIVIDELGYALGTAPLGMVLDKEFEFYSDISKPGTVGQTAPLFCLKPGEFISVITNMRIEAKSYYTTPTIAIKATSGLRSVFFASSIKENNCHGRFRKRFQTRTRAPRDLYDQHPIFKDLLHHYYKKHPNEKQWRGALIYFSKQWIEAIHNDPAFLRLKVYLNQQVWKRYNYFRSKFASELTFSNLFKEKRLKPDPNMVNTLHHLLKIASGYAPGFAPLLSNESMPVELMQWLYVYVYNLDFSPVILGPQYYHFKTDKHPIYYSYYYPTMDIFSRSKIESTNRIQHIREFDYYTPKILKALSSNDSITAGTDIQTIAQGLEFKYYHCEKDMEGLTDVNSNIVFNDRRFAPKSQFHSKPKMRIGKESWFLRGCIQMKVKTKK